MRFEVLGPLRVWSGDEELSLGEPQQQKLLALLLAAPDHALTSDRLVDEMWGADPPASAQHLVQVYVSRLRTVFRAVEDVERIPREGGGYRLRIVPGEVDAEELSATIEDARLARMEEPRAAARRLQEALARGGDVPLPSSRMRPPRCGRRPSAWRGSTSAPSRSR